LKEEMKLQK